MGMLDSKLFLEATPNMTGTSDETHQDLARTRARDLLKFNYMAM